MRILKKLFRGLIAVVLVLLVVFLIARVFLSNNLPEGVSGQEAERLADKMLEALNYEAYEQLQEIEWTYAGGHHYIWSKAVDSVEVSWDTKRVKFCTSTLKGYAFEGESKAEGATKDALLQKAWEYFANDSFWLVAPFKVRDPGTSRSIVTTSIGHGLLVTYSSGGVTPGDSYLWILDSNGRPVAWQMWVSIIPIPGLEISWEGWQDKSDVWFCTAHQGPGPFKLYIEDLKIR